MQADKFPLSETWLFLLRNEFSFCVSLSGQIIEYLEHPQRFRPDFSESLGKKASFFYSGL